jgi:hypothetical protein
MKILNLFTCPIITWRYNVFFLQNIWRNACVFGFALYFIIQQFKGRPNTRINFVFQMLGSRYRCAMPRVLCCSGTWVMINIVYGKCGEEIASQ